MSYIAHIQATSPGTIIHASDDSSYARLLATWDANDGEPPTEAEYGDTVTAAVAARPWEQFRAARDAGFRHWNRHIPSMLMLGYPPAVAIKTDIAAAYQELLDLPDSGVTADEAMARMSELDQWLSAELGRPPAFPPA